MTQLEFDTFLIDEIKGRWPKYEPTTAMVADWWNALRYYSVDVATEAVQEHRLDEKSNVFEPIVSVVARILRTKRARQVSGLAPLWRPWVQCIEAPAEHPDWVGRQWQRGEFLFSGNAASKQVVARAAEKAAELIEKAEGGRWTGVVRPDGQMPADWPDLPDAEYREWLERHIIEGPDGPGRRFIQQTGRPWMKAVANSFSLEGHE